MDQSKSPKVVLKKVPSSPTLPPAKGPVVLKKLDSSSSVSTPAKKAEPPVIYKKAASSIDLPTKPKSASPVLIKKVDSPSKPVSSTTTTTTTSTSTASSTTTTGSPSAAKKPEKPDLKKYASSPAFGAKPKQPTLGGTNISGLGTSMEVEARLAAAQTEEAWATAGQKVGIEIWRIEKFQVKAWPLDQYGNFYNGDSYIILSTYHKKPGSAAFAWDVHFWLGSKSTQDETGTAAYKTVELDDYLGGDPVQHREVQGHESALFMSYFESGIKILEGGIESGFTIVGPKEYKPRLLHIKGSKNIRVMQVELSHKSLNSGDVFILDAGVKLYQWQGKQSSPAERQKAGTIARTIADERGINSRNLVVIDEVSNEKNEDFWRFLGGRAAVASAVEGGNDEEFDVGVAPKRSVQKRMFKLSDETGKLLFTDIAKDVIKKSLLNSMDVFIFDNGSHVFVWVGKGSSKNERKKSIQYAQDYLKAYKRPLYLPITRIVEGGQANKQFDGSFDG